ncbi:AEC family transporter [Propionibacteriaceae bacterium Y1685]|uniref:AEC family transporter n=1 Tax=Microlunatus sp. Y1700 TaxID=3418487 RepID=UPI003B7DCCE2
MSGVLTGFAVLAIIIGAGWLLAHLRVLDESSQQVLARLAFFIASPALMITVLGDADVHKLFSTNLIASISGVAVTALLHILLARLVFRRTASDTVIGTFCSSYVNAGNLGLPIAAYVIGDAAAIAPMLITQLMLLQPAGLTVLDVIEARRRGQTGRARLIRTMITRPFTNPMLIGSGIGVLLAVTGWRLPEVVHAPLELIGGMAVPGMLIAYGVALRLGPLPGRGEPAPYLATIATLKLIIQPVVAWFVGAQLLGLTGPALLGVMIIAALPTAQNVFTFALRYRTGQTLARDAIFVNTVGSVAVIIGIVALMS